MIVASLASPGVRLRWLADCSEPLVGTMPHSLGGIPTDVLLQQCSTKPCGVFGCDEWMLPTDVELRLRYLLGLGLANESLASEECATIIRSILYWHTVGVLYSCCRIFTHPWYCTFVYLVPTCLCQMSMASRDLLQAWLLRKIDRLH